VFVAFEVVNVKATSPKKMIDVFMMIIFFIINFLFCYCSDVKILL